MRTAISLPAKARTVEPLCPLFGQCGGCQYQDIPYTKELQFKEDNLRKLFKNELSTKDSLFEGIVSSPREYHYRSRLDVRLLKTKNQDVFIGFAPQGSYRVVPAESCVIAMKAISDFLPELKRQAVVNLPKRYRNANLVVKTGDDGRVFWGGIGRRSLRMKEEDYLWTIIHGKKIFYSLDTFFQANLSILPEVINRVEALRIFNPKTCFYDLYGGVGLLGLCLYEQVNKVILIEDNIHAVRLAQYNIASHQLKNFEIITGKVEEQFLPLLQSQTSDHAVAMIDPPRQGLSKEVAGALAVTRNLRYLLYLSCHPESLVRDLVIFTKSRWEIKKIIPFDFFPKTKHLETLVVLKREKRD